MLFGVLICLLLAVTPRLCSAIAELQDEVEALEANVGSRVKIGALTDGIESRGVVFCEIWPRAHSPSIELDGDTFFVWSHTISLKTFAKPHVYQKEEEPIGQPGRRAGGLPLQCGHSVSSGRLLVQRTCP